MITDINQLDLEKTYTYSDYLSWQFEEMVELIRGKVVRMSPAPNRYHQRVSGNLFSFIGPYFRGKKCQAYHAPFDVRLPVPPPPENATTVVQPDICVICDENKLDIQGCNGAPDWIIEILSPATSKKDLTDKFQLYQNAKVKEYWIVHPSDGTVIPFHLDADENYESIRRTPFAKGEKVQVGIFPELVIDLDEIFNW